MEIKKELKTSNFEPEVPIINVEPNVEEIKAAATDINPEPVVNKDFYEPPVIKSTEENKPLPNKFFNFLEDEAVNMNMDTDESEV